MVDSITKVMDRIGDLHTDLVFIIIIIVIMVLFVFNDILLGYGYSILYCNKNGINSLDVLLRRKLLLKMNNIVHGTFLEIIWTIIPAVILVGLAIPSYNLLYMLDSGYTPDLTVKVIGNQWYWTYEIRLSKDVNIVFDSYQKLEEDLKKGEYRLLEVDKELYIPVGTRLRFIITSRDVLHSFSLPAAGLKVDAVPGRLNQIDTLMEREGMYYGQCSEICGVGHGNMPIVIRVVSLEKYLAWVKINIIE